MKIKHKSLNYILRNLANINLVAKSYYKLAICLFIVFFIAISNCCDAKKEPNSCLDIDLLPEYNSNYSVGYSYCGFLIKNLSNSKKTVNIQLFHKEDKDSLISSEKTIELEGLEAKKEYLYCVNTYSNERKVFFAKFLVDGNPDTEINIPKVPDSKIHAYKISVLLDMKFPKTECENLFLLNENVSYYCGDYAFTDNDLSEGDKEGKISLPDEWIAYSQFEYVMLFDDSYNSSSDAVKKALLEYTRAGGNLYILGEIEIPEDARDFLLTDKYGMNAKCRLGFGTLAFFQKDFFNKLCLDDGNNSKTKSNASDSNIQNNQDRQEVLKAFKPLNSPRGRFSFMDNDYLGAISTYISKTNFKSEIDTSSFLRSSYKPKPQTNTDPKSLLLCGLCIFIIFLIGPVNILILKKYNKLKLFFVTAPIIGVLCGLTVFIYYLLTSYWTFDIYRQSITMLNEKQKSAVTFGSEAFYANRNIDKPLEFPIGSVIVPFMKYKEFKASPNRPRVITFDNTQMLSKNWIRAKKPVAFSVTFSGQSNATIGLKKCDDGYIITNSLGAKINKIYIATPDGKKVYTNQDIDTGATVTVKNSLPNRYLFDRPCPLSPLEFANYASLEKQYLDVLKPGEYIAFLKSDPFLAQKIDSEANINELGCVVIGIPEKGV